MVKHSLYGGSRRKESVERRKTKDNTTDTYDKNQQTNGTFRAPRGNSNWEKYRSVVSQTDSLQKPSKRHYHNSVRTQRNNYKTPRMVPPDGHSQSPTKNKSSTNNELTRHIAMDCEMVGIGDGKESMLARVSLVNRHGVCVYDKYVKPREEVQDYRTSVSGIRPHHLKNGEDFDVVQAEVSEILHGRILIGHALTNDLRVLFLSHPKRHLRDTSRYKPFRKVVMGNTPSLKKLAAELLGVDIQSGEHNSIEDARAAMQLYVLYKAHWEKDLHSRSSK